MAAPKKKTARMADGSTQKVARMADGQEKPQWLVKGRIIVDKLSIVEH